MSFAELSRAADRLRSSLKSSTGRDLITPVSLETPSNDTMEISFHKAVLWGYAFWFEACQPAGRYLLNVVRNTSPTDHKLASRAFTDVQNLRTSKTHNLNPTDKGDRHKLNQAEVWLIQNGGQLGDWGACTTSLCNSLASALNILADRWESIILSDEDAKIGVQELLFVIDHEWPAHLFDRMVEEAAAHLHLTDLDPVAYRKGRLMDWRTITEVFSDRMSAETAIRRAILQELSLKFGPAL
jgi:hypothetical protein